MHAQITQHLAVDVDLGFERHAETGPPAPRLALVIGEDVGLQRGEFLLADLAPDRLDAVEIGDRRLVPVGMVDAPGRAMRPVDPDAVADLAAEQFVAGHAEQLALGIEQGVFDRAERLRDDAAGSRGGSPRTAPHKFARAEEFLPDYARGQTLDRRADAWRAKTFVEFAPANDAVFRGDLDER